MELIKAAIIALVLGALGGAMVAFVMVSVLEKLYPRIKTVFKPKDDEPSTSVPVGHLNLIRSVPKGNNVKYGAYVPLTEDQCNEMLLQHYKASGSYPYGDPVDRLKWYRDMIRMAHKEGHKSGTREG